MEKNEYLLKIVVLGYSTRLKEKLIYDFTSIKMTNPKYISGFEIVSRKVIVEKKKIKLILLVTKEDTSFNFGKLKRSWYRGASAGVIFFDKGNIEEFKVVEKDIKEFRKYTPDTKVPLHIVGVKSDKNLVIAEQTQILADKYQIKYFEVSFDDPKSLRKVFRSLTSLGFKISRILEIQMGRVGRQMEEYQSKNEYSLKICVIGSPDKLKTEFIRSFAERQFTDYYNTQGVAITTKKIQIDTNNIKLILAEASGKEFFGELRPSYYRGASGAVICYEKTTIGLKVVTDWYNEFRKHTPDPRIPITLVCINTGLDEITTEEGQILAKELGIKYYEWTPRPKERLLDKRRERKRLMAKENEEVFREITKRALEAKESVQD
jgi:GTPase SAR1 family protein